MDEKNENEVRIHPVNPEYVMDRMDTSAEKTHDQTSQDENQLPQEETSEIGDSLISKEDTVASAIEENVTDPVAVNGAEEGMKEPGNYVFGGNGPDRGNGSFTKIVGGLVAVASLVVILAGLLLIGRFVKPGSAEVNGTESASDVAAATTQEAEPVSGTTEAVDNAFLTKGEIGATNMVEGSFLDVSPIVKEVMPTVVAVTNETIYTSYYGGWLGQNSQDAVGAGSGVIIAQNDTELLIVSNAHVVIPEEYQGYSVSSCEISVSFLDGEEEVSAYVKGTDVAADIAVIAVNLNDISEETKGKIKIATIGDSSLLEVGNGVIAIGNALGYGQSMTVGYVSALSRNVTFSDGATRNFLQVDAAINPGNSGGGLFDMRGQLIGINSAKYADEKVEGIGYAIPITSVEEIIVELMNSETRHQVTDEEKKAALGVQCEAYYQSMYEGTGAFITGVTAGGAAEKAGIMAYDIITGIDGHKIEGWNDLQKEISYYEGGTTVTVTYLTLEESDGSRKYVEKETEVTLGYYKDLVQPK